MSGSDAAFWGSMLGQLVGAIFGLFVLVGIARTILLRFRGFRICPHCSNKIRSNTQKCYFCNQWLQEPTPAEEVVDLASIDRSQATPLEKPQELNMLQDMQSKHLSRQGIMLKYNLTLSNFVRYCEIFLSNGSFSRDDYDRLVCGVAIANVGLSQQHVVNLNESHKKCVIEKEENDGQSEGDSPCVPPGPSDAESAPPDQDDRKYLKLTAIERQRTLLIAGSIILGVMGFVSYFIIKTPMGLLFILAAEIGMVCIVYRVSQFLERTKPKIVVFSVLALLPILWIVPVCALMTGLGRARKSVMRGGDPIAVAPDWSQQVGTCGRDLGFAKGNVSTGSESEEGMMRMGSRQVSGKKDGSDICDRLEAGSVPVRSDQPAAFGDADAQRVLNQEDPSGTEKAYSSPATTNSSRVIMLEEVGTATSTEGTRLCPYCAEEIKSAAVKCKHCGEWLGKGKK